MVKQVIVVRGDLLDQMGVGKMAAQVAHASMKVFFDRIEDIKHDSDTLDRHTFCFSANNAEKEWIEGSFTKVVVKCKNLNELLKIEQKAIAAGIPCAKIEDNGTTVFRETCPKCNGNGWTEEHSPYAGDHDEDGSCNGGCPIQMPCENCQQKGTIAVPTITCIAVGPADSEILDPITGRLRLL